MLYSYSNHYPDFYQSDFLALGWSAEDFIDKESTKTEWWRSAALWDDNVCENQITSIPAGLTWRRSGLSKS